VRERNPRSRIPFCASYRRLDVKAAPAREADGFRDVRERNPRSRIPFCASYEYADVIAFRT
jgi:hypothetical protein